MTLEGNTSLSRLRFLIVNGFTSFNLLIGVLSLIAASLGETHLAAWGLLCCVALDGCDGSLARRWRVTSSFGAHLDSLADMTSFMIAGASLIFYWVYWLQPAPPLWLIGVMSGLYALAGALRLARFNASPPDRRFFQGVPTTFAATVVAANYLFNPALTAGQVLALVGLLSVLMVCTLPYPKLATMLRCPPWVWLAAAALALSDLQLAVATLTIAYLSLGPAIWLWRRVRG